MTVCFLWIYLFFVQAAVLENVLGNQANSGFNISCLSQFVYSSVIIYPFILVYWKCCTLGLCVIGRV